MKYFLLIILFTFSIINGAHAYLPNNWGWGDFNPTFDGTALSWTAHKNGQFFPSITLIKEGNLITRVREFKGRFVLVNLWATWCAPCVAEMPGLNQLQKDFGSDIFHVLPISIDQNGMEKVKNFFDTNGIDALEPWVDKNGSSEKIKGILGLPTSILLDPFGKEVLRIDGAVDWDSPYARSAIKYYIDYWYSMTDKRLESCESEKNRQVSPYEGECK